MTMLNGDYPYVIIKLTVLGDFSMGKAKERIYLCDNIKGILIFLVVLAHFFIDYKNSDAIDLIVRGIYLFHMPAFVFLSGFFGKSKSSQSALGIVKLGFIYILFNSLMGICTGTENILVPLYSFWYLLALVFWRLTAKYVAKVRFSLLIVTLVALFAGCFSYIDNTFALSRFICFYPFYLAGYLLDINKLKVYISTKKSRRITAGFIALSAAVLLWYVLIVQYNCSMSQLLMDPYQNSFYVLIRILIFVTATLAILALISLIPNRPIFLLSQIGRNSLTIYVFHRLLVLLLIPVFAKFNVALVILLSVLSTVFMCILFGNDIFGKWFASFVDGCVNSFIIKNGSTKNKHCSVYRAFTLLTVICWLVTSILSPGVGLINKESESAESGDEIYRIISEEQMNRFNNAYKIVFSGDLILLEDQVKRAYKNGVYEFDDMFEYASPYISSADLAIGVFEGPMAGESGGYSVGNFDDGKELRLNFPDSFASAVKKAGFDLVTNANNHLLDKGESGAIRTIDELDSIGLNHTGSYKNSEDKEKNHIKILSQNGLKFAVLSYTYGANYTETDDLINGKYKYLTSVISGTEGEQFEKLKKDVEKDFEKARSYNPDLIIVLPHIGTQFTNEIDEEQRTWFKIFKDNGADIILGDHSHTVQPAKIEKHNNKNVFEAYSPGNFANVYRDNQGDISALIEVYIDRDNKEIIGGGVVPLYTQAQMNSNFRALPTYEIEYNNKLQSDLSTDDLAKAETANQTVTKVMFGSEMNISTATRSYLFDEKGFIRTKNQNLRMTEAHRKGLLWKAISGADSICFLGDSITEGTKNGGAPWYEPIEKYMEDKTVSNFSKGSCAVSYLTENADKIPSSDLYVIAIGTNDIRYRDKSICAMDSKEYISRISNLRELIKNKNKNAKFVWIAPWYSESGDKNCKLNDSEKLKMNDEYSLALQGYAKSSGDIYISVNSELKNFFSVNPCNEYLLDSIHPNSGKGIILYSDLVLSK